MAKNVGRCHLLVRLGPGTICLVRGLRRIAEFSKLDQPGWTLNKNFFNSPNTFFLLWLGGIWAVAGYGQSSGFEKFALGDLYFEA